jgi:hypothetical protein
MKGKELTKSKKPIQEAPMKARFLRKRRGITGRLANLLSQTPNAMSRTSPTTSIAIIEAERNKPDYFRSLAR